MNPTLRARMEGIINLIFMMAFFLFWTAFALVSESALCRIGCAELALASLWLAYTAGLRRAALLRERRFYSNPWYSTTLPLAPGAALGIAGWVLSSPEQWASAAGLAAFLAFLTALLWRIAQSEGTRLETEVLG